MNREQAIALLRRHSDAAPHRPTFGPMNWIVDAVMEAANTGSTEKPLGAAWVSVEERLPVGRKPEVLFYSPDLRNPTDMLLGIYTNGKWLCAGFEMVNVTHWAARPITPALPQKELKAQKSL